MKRKLHSRFQSLRFKLMTAALLLLIIPCLLIGLQTYQAATSSLDELGQRALKNNVRLTMEMIKSLQEYVERGDISLEEAQESVKSRILGPRKADGTRDINPNIDVGASGYIFVLDEKGVMLASPQIEGVDTWETVGPDGSLFTQEIIHKAMNGGDFTYYYWPSMENPDVLAEKVTYAEQDPYWGWIICAGTYTSDFNKPAESLLYQVLIVTAVFILLGMVFVSFASGRISKPIVAIAQNVNRVAEGDLTVEKIQVKSNDEVGQLAQDVNVMVANLRTLIQQVGNSSDHVAATSEQLSASAQQTSQATEQIATVIQDVAQGTESQIRTFEENSRTASAMSASLQQISANTEQLYTNVTNSSSTVNEGNAAIQTTIQQMNSINATVSGLSDSIRSLGERSREIGQIVEVITGIAEQTNLLALNAAIEAARAGEHGKGFAVVADEVRKLAEQSANSTQQIVELIATIQAETGSAITSMQTTTAEVAAGIDVVNQAGRSFQEIDQSIKEVVLQIQEVSQATSHLSKGTEQFVRSMESVFEMASTTSDATQNISAAAEEQLASMEEISSSANALSQMAEELQNLVQKFKV